MKSAPEIHRILGMPAIIASPAMHGLMRLVERVAATRASVLILGESGAGKELVARAVHSYSPRASRPWVDVSCAALPEHLMESELFGYEKGAFSGADSAKPGLFELAHEGTLFLDEIGDLDARMQVKLLRVLDGTPYFRLGGTRKVSVDVRVIAATNHDLEAQVEDGRFRSDLFHRLNQVTLTVPPLRERPEDILPLAQFFLEHHHPGVRLGPTAASLLQEYGWPGNIRELRNVLTKAAVMAPGPVLDASDLPIDPGRATTASLIRAAQAVAATNLDDMEERMIQQALQQTGGHQQRAAALLGISRRTLSRKLKAYEERANHENCA
jgi:transcriptional regulator with PAS, ATPase and Fis domain